MCTSGAFGSGVGVGGSVGSVEAVGTTVGSGVGGTVGAVVDVGTTVGGANGDVGRAVTVAGVCVAVGATVGSAGDTEAVPGGSEQATEANITISIRATVSARAHRHNLTSLHIRCDAASSAWP
jgi:hypothetical protein